MGSFIKPKSSFSNRSRNESEKQSFNYSEKTKMLKILPMLIMVVLIFIICWTPLLMFNILQSFQMIPTQLFGFLKHLKTTFSLLAYSNSCINPVIYGFMSASFRQSFKDLLWSNTKVTKNHSASGSQESQTHKNHWKGRISSSELKPCECNSRDPF